jgi:hypothetical protein
VSALGSPDKVREHGLHLDMWWPHVIHSVWNLGRVRIARERTYAEWNHRTLTTETWKIELATRRAFSHGT